MIRTTDLEWLTDGTVTSPLGFQAGAVAAGLKKSGGLDLCLIASDTPCAAAGVFTTNRVQAAPVRLDRERLQKARAQAIVVNSGNANACTGPQGDEDAREMARLAAARLGLAEDLVLVASTGVIGVPLPMDRIREGIARITVGPDGGALAAQAIMTTDTRPKAGAVRLEIAGRPVTIGGIAKGAGMIHPHMATMLAFLTTDAAVDPAWLNTALRQAVDQSFNQISVDGDTSTNDTVLILANGQAGAPLLHSASPEAPAFQAALEALCGELAKMIARDGEGATKLIEAVVEGAASLADARRAARAIVSSNLIKAMVYGNDPNWGRILCAVGYSGAAVDERRAEVWIGDVLLFQDGRPVPADREAARAALQGPEVHLRVHLHLGPARATAWGCDLTEGYVEINAKYTT